MGNHRVSLHPNARLMFLTQFWSMQMTWQETNYLCLPLALIELCRVSSEMNWRELVATGFGKFVRSHRISVALASLTASSRCEMNHFVTFINSEGSKAPQLIEFCVAPANNFNLFLLLCFRFVSFVSLSTIKFDVVSPSRGALLGKFNASLEGLERKFMRRLRGVHSHLKRFALKILR